MIPHECTAERHHAAGDAFSETHDVWHHTETIGREEFTESTKGRNDFVEDQQDAVAITDLAQAFKVADRWHDDTGRSLHGFGR